MENQDNKNNKKDEIISRRKFFKRAAGMVIPAIALTVLPSALTSCEIDEPYPGEVVLAARSVDGYSYAQVADILFDEPLHFLLVIVYSVGGEAEPVGVEPMVVATEHLDFQIVTNLVDQVDFEKRLSADEVPHDGLLCVFPLMAEDIVDGRFRNVPRHALFFVFSDKIAVFASELAVFGDNKRDVFCHSFLPTFFVVFNFHITIKKALYICRKATVFFNTGRRARGKP